MKQKEIAVILIDMQDFFLQHFKAPIRDTLVKNQIHVLKLCAKKKIPVFVVEYECLGINRGPTTQSLRSILARLPCATKEPVLKENNSAFTNTNLDADLKQLKIKKLILMGINANGCVQDTAIAARHRGYDVITSLETMASASYGDFGLSRKNLAWYQKNTVMFKEVTQLMNTLDR